GRRCRTTSNARHGAGADPGEMILPSIASRIVRVSSYLVPRWRRSDWTREWQAELHCGSNAGGGSPSVLVRSFGAPVDALWLRVQAAQPDLWWGDVRFAARNAATRPTFTLLVTLILAIGTGIGGAGFALVGG